MPARPSDEMHHLYRSYYQCCLYAGLAIYMVPAGMANPLCWKSLLQNEIRSGINVGNGDVLAHDEEAHVSISFCYLNSRILVFWLLHEQHQPFIITYITMCLQHLYTRITKYHRDPENAKIKISREATVAAGIWLNYLPGPSSVEEGGWAFRERKDCVGEERRAGDGFVFIHQRVSSARKVAFLWHTCVCVK